jgi:hypothetical protein
MANLNVTASISTGLYTITIDWNDWETFTVYDNTNPKTVIPVVPNQASSYSQTSQGPLTFKLTAKTNTIVNPTDVTGYSGILKGDKKDNYQLTCNFRNPSKDQENWTLNGVCNEVPVTWPVETSPSLFSAIHMTGSFATTP